MGKKISRHSDSDYLAQHPEFSAEMINLKFYYIK
jgi:hypothetical protein